LNLELKSADNIAETYIVIAGTAASDLQHCLGRSKNSYSKNKKAMLWTTMYLLFWSPFVACL